MFVSGLDNGPDAFYGASSMRTFENLHVDVAFLSTPAVHDNNLYNPYEYVAEIKKSMIRSAKTSVLLVDHTKFARRAMHRMCSITDFDIVITDWLTPEDELNKMRESGVDLRVAPNPSLP